MEGGITFKRKDKVVRALFEMWVSAPDPVPKVSAPDDGTTADPVVTTAVKDLGEDATATFTTHIVADKEVHPLVNQSADYLEDRLIGAFALNALPLYYYRPRDSDSGPGGVVGFVP